MRKNGFTLIELLGVIVLISVISFVSFPTILNHIKNADNEISELTETLVIDAAKDYVDDNLNSFPKKNNSTYCITISKLSNSNYLDENVLKENESLKDKKIKITFVTKYNYEIVNDCTDN